MHIPDGLIDAKTAAVTAALAAAGLGMALREVQRQLPPRRVPLLGLSAAFLFVAQMINFPVLAGTSGHLLGGVLVAALLGPGAAVVVLAAVLIVQAFLFGDGGVLALGANLFNMALLGAVGGWWVYRWASRIWPGPQGHLTGVAFGGWCSTVLAAIGCSGMLAWSGKAPWAVAFSAMAGIHMIIGLGEGLISALVWAALWRLRPDLVAQPQTPQSGVPATGWIGYGLLVALGLALFVVPFACPWPDGLERALTKLGLERAELRPVVPPLAPDYQVPGVSHAAVATAIAGAAGALIVFALAWLLGRWLVRSAGPNRVGAARD
jgi:cobalt/nickel transport system permease protein